MSHTHGKVILREKCSCVQMSIHEFQNDLTPFKSPCSKVLCVAMVFTCDVLELTGIVTSFLKSTMNGASAKYR